MDFNKAMIKQLFRINSRTKLTDEDHKNMSIFVRGVMIGNGWECKCYVRDFLEFQKNYHLNWKKLFDRADEKRKEGVCEWPFIKGDDIEFTEIDKVYKTAGSIENLPLSDWQM